MTRSGNRRAIESALPDLAERDDLHFIYVDPPRWIVPLDRFRNGGRLGYLPWQLAVLRAGRRLHRRQSFDAVWHLTYANAWIGSVGGLVGPTFIYGPIGGGVDFPWRLVGAIGPMGVVYEVVRKTARTVTRIANPLARIAWRRAGLVIVQNRETRDWLPARHRSKAVVAQNSVTKQVFESADRESHPPTALFAARLIPWKGGVLALRAIAALPSWRLVICGGGSDENRLRALAAKLNLGERVEFAGLLTHEKVGSMMQQADVLLHPSLRDDAPLVIGEALAHGLPIVCLDRGGPPLLAGAAAHSVPVSGSVETVVAGLAAALEGALDPRSRDIAIRRANELSFDRRVELVNELLRSAVAPSGATLPTEVREPASVRGAS